MPRKRRTPRARRRRPTEYGRGHLFHLKKGYWFFPLDWPPAPNGGDPIEHAWRELREEVLEEWIAERPGTRPWAWWRYDALEPRRAISSGQPWPEYEEEREYLGRLGLFDAREHIP